MARGLRRQSTLADVQDLPSVIVVSRPRRLDHRVLGYRTIPVCVVAFAPSAQSTRDLPSTGEVQVLLDDRPIDGHGRSGLGSNGVFLRSDGAQVSEEWHYEPDHVLSHF